MSRNIYEIAKDIKADWANVYFGAVPYLDAMSYLGNAADYYGADSAKCIIIYFLDNAKTWRGAKAREIKLELKGMIK